MLIELRVVEAPTGTCHSVIAVYILNTPHIMFIKMLVDMPNIALLPRIANFNDKLIVVTYSMLCFIT